MISISICYKFVEGPWGGINQFLKVLREEFIKKGIYEENYTKAEVILFNSYPFRSEYFFDEVFKLKQKYPEKIIIYRLDGPISLYRNRDKEVDKVISVFNNLFADGIIFQSNWCRKQNKKLFGISSKYETVIHNASDNKIFNRDDKKEFNPQGKIKLIATSWSSNWRKGFEIYKYLDENLNFSKYEVTFVGNSPVEFKNIKWIKPVSSEKLAEILKQHDIFITASQNDPCSNSLIEALSCGLPVVVLNDGGHPELVKEGGELFNGRKDVIEKIEKVVQNFHYYKSKIPEFSIEKVTQNYYEFIQKIYKDVQNGLYQPKKINLSTKLNFYKMKFIILRWKIKTKLETIKAKLWKI
jgi:glycosyltransferase involved in cell wall biosynthesis